MWYHQISSLTLPFHLLICRPTVSELFSMFRVTWLIILLSCYTDLMMPFLPRSRIPSDIVVVIWILYYTKGIHNVSYCIYPFPISSNLIKLHVRPFIMYKFLRFHCIIERHSKAWQVLPKTPSTAELGITPCEFGLQVYCIVLSKGAEKQSCRQYIFLQFCVWNNFSKHFAEEIGPDWCAPHLVNSRVNNV
jgi:hypothetical protein